jgi:FkbM family methyltransferase
LELINLSALRADTLVGKIVRYPLRILPRDLIVPILQGPLRGKKWIAASHLHSCWLGSYELEIQKRVVKEVKSGDVFYDVGANVGFYSLLAATLIAPGRVYAMEPVPANLGYLRKHLELNRVDNVEVFETAICDQVGSTFFEVEATRAMGRIAAGGGVRVATSTLDALLREGKIAPPDCIKMDIEGAESRALLGAQECFERYRPKLFLALHGREVHDECCRLLSSWKYEIQYTTRDSEDRAELFAYSPAEQRR